MGHYHRVSSQPGRTPRRVDRPGALRQRCYCQHHCASSGVNRRRERCSRRCRGAGFLSLGENPSRIDGVARGAMRLGGGTDGVGVERRLTGLSRTVIATENIISRFYSMTDDGAAAVSARWSQCLNGAFEAVESVQLAVHHHQKCLRVIVSARLAFAHKSFRGLVVVPLFPLLPCRCSLAAGASRALGAAGATVSCPVDFHSGLRPFVLGHAASGAHRLNHAMMSCSRLVHVIDRLQRFLFVFLRRRPLTADAWTALPFRPDPLFFPPPLNLLTVAQARFLASVGRIPRSS